MTTLNKHVYHNPVNFHFKHNPINLVQLRSVSKFASTKLTVCILKASVVFCSIYSLKDFFRGNNSFKFKDLSKKSFCDNTTKT